MYVHGTMGDGRYEGRVEGSETLAVVAQFRSHRPHGGCRNDSALGKGHQRPRLVYQPLVSARPGRRRYGCRRNGEGAAHT